MRMDKTLLPKLRFPEFQNAPEWEASQLKDISSAVFDGTHQTPTYTSEGVPFYSVENIVSGAKNKFISHDDYIIATNKNKPEKGDILLTRIGKIGYSQVVTWNYEFSVYVTLAVIKGAKSFLSHYLHYFMQSERYQKELFSKSLLNAVPPKINMDSLRGTKVLLPNLSEQQKIADCLTSLDDLIAAQSQKVEALQAYKKGLLQNLFPAEGESVPRLRFPEFQSAGEWEVKPLGSKVTKVGSGITPKGGDKNYKNKGRPFVRSQNVGWGELILDDVAFIDDATHATFPDTEITEGDVLLNITGASIGRSAIADSQILGGNVNQHVCIIRLKVDELNPRYLNQYLLSQYGQKQVDSFQAGGNRQGLNFAQVRSFSIPVPQQVSEQQRIAELLSALDEQISAQGEALAALKVHKKGLMQGLFAGGGGAG